MQFLLWLNHFPTNICDEYLKNSTSSPSILPPRSPQKKSSRSPIHLPSFLKEEQKKRFLERLNDESKNWKFSSADIKERQYWNHYMKAYSDVLTETSTEIAPWYVIPADNKWFMRYAVGRIICTRMEALDLHYPQLSKEELERLEECKKSVSDINF